MLRIIIMLGIILALPVEGNQRIVQVSEYISDDILPNGEDDNNFTCCVYGNCSCNSLDHALANLTSNVLINITTDVTLSSLIKVSSLANVSIIGHNIPTVNCRNIGGMYFAFCHNCIFQGITWDGCGNHNESGLKLTYSSNITILNCVFQYSIGQVVALSMSKDANIAHCNFVNNKGVCIYVINQYLHFNGKILFQNNTAKSGPGVQIHDHSTVIFNENSDVSFIHNLATFSGGAVFLRNNSSVLFDQNSMVVFNKNNALYGAAIYSEVNSNITFTGACEVTFENNFGNLHGSAIHTFEMSNLLCMEYSVPIFSNNQNLIEGTYFNEGTIYLEDNGHISFEGNSFTVFYNNTASTGGAIFAHESNISFKDESTTKFCNNTAIFKGGAIGFKTGTMSFEDNSTTEFYSNTAMSSCGGAIYSDYYSYISFKNNSTAIFNNNSAANGGGISSYDSLSFEGNSFTRFYNNRATNGGAVAAGNIEGSASDLTFSDSSTTTFYNNFATLFGGAVYSLSYRPASFKDSSNTKFINNTAYDGGALCSRKYSYISFRGSSYTMFVDNIARHHGGVVFAEDHSDIDISNNSVVTFNNNKATSGAIVYSFDSSKIIATGNSSVIINNLPAKWCTNACLPYTSQSNDIVLINSNGLVWCSNLKSFVCQSEKCYCKNLKDILVGSDSTVFTITDKVLLSSFISLQYLNNVSIIGHNKLTVICVNDGGLYLEDFDNLTVESITFVMCGSFSTFQPVLSINDGSNVMIRNCSFQHSLGAAISVDSMKGNMNISHCSFTNNNHYTDHGSAVTVKYAFRLWQKYLLTLNNCNFSYNGPSKSVVYIGFIKDLTYSNSDDVYFTNSNFCNNKGTSIYVLYHVLYIMGEVLFKNNMAESGAGIYANDRSIVVFDKNSNVKFINNSADYSGAAIFINTRSALKFEQNSIVEFNNNKATNGTVYSYNSEVIFAATCQVTFSSNSATQYGATIYSSYSSYVTFTGSSKVTLNDNIVSSNTKDLQVGGNIFSTSYSHISFEENSVTVFKNNIADFGVAIFSFNNSNIRFMDRSRVVFTNNIAHYCGVLTSALYSSVTFNGNAEVTYDTNIVSGILHSVYESSDSGGAICAFQRASVMFSGHSFTAFINNRAMRGGAAVFSETSVIIQEHATVKFDNNIAEYSSGGAIVCFKNSTMSFKDNSNVIFHGNKASQSGGAVHSYDLCNIKFKGNSTLQFINNTARDDGGAILSSEHSEVIFEENATVLFDYNMADNGGTFYFTNSTITFTDSSMVSFYNNIARRRGGVGHFVLNSNVTFAGTTAVKFDNNKAEQNAGVLYLAQSNISCKENSILTSTDNTATLNGGAFYFDYYSNVTFSQFTNFTFNHNRALHGGAILVNDHSNITITGSSVLAFVNNSAAQYGGAIFLDTTALMIAIDNCNHSIKFKDNIANVLGDSLYQKVEICQNMYSCLNLNDRVVGISNEFIATPPNELKLDDAVICIDNNTQCNHYYIKNIMLGTEIVIPACVLDYYNHSVDSTQFLLHSELPTSYFINGPKEVLISCDALEGISIMSNQSLSKSINFSINITLNTVFNPDWKQISVNLIIELSPCHPGFWQYPKSKQCECYNASDIVFCSGSSSTIKRGYWFGSVTGKPTVTFCPINYCNFTCCETSNGYYHLSPIRDNQCMSHRSGTACGSCTDGYTLSFDSPKCVNVDSCTAAHTVLVILLTVIYWIVIVALVFGMMYYKVGIWYLYSITYYYSIADILLNQNLQATRGLYITVNVMSSFSKITPQFLGELCLTTGMSGIDQQFIHYIHPSAIVVMLVVISLVARRSRRISNIISRGIIHVICLLLLLSYTSMASTSLLLMRSLTFHEINKVYTYVSPDIEYFHGRHLAYSIVALICTVFIVIGLPLLLTLEPFLNCKINFTKIKPLLDQFQGGYKDKCRCFAGYYMICRLLIIVILITNSSNDFITNYMLITACGIIALIHLLIKPYANNEILNRFDGIILQLIIFTAALPLFDNLNSPLVITIAFVLITFPLLSFIAIALFFNRDNLKKIIKYFTNKNESPHDYVRVTNDVNNETELREFKTIIVDDSKRKNAIICDV